MFTTTTNQDATTEVQQTSRRPSTTTEATSSPFGDVGLGVMLGGTLLLGLVGLGTYTVWRRRIGLEDTDQAATASPEGESAVTTQAPTSQEVPSDDPVTGAEVMTDAERVQTLLEATDGRMRQTAIADEFDWSASKVSRVIGKMVDEGTVEKLQLGRENLIELDDTDE